MIPKIIHYIWFNKEPIPDLYKKYIDTWYKFCPDFEIKCWTLNNYEFDLNIDYIKILYERNKYGFLSDYCRYDILNRFGGIYLDIDVELLKPIYDFYNSADAVFGFNRRSQWLSKYRPYNEYVASGLGFSSIKEHPILNMLMKCYTQKYIEPSHGFCNTKRESVVFKKIGIIRNDTTQTVNIDKYTVKVYSSEFLCPFNRIKGRITNNTVSNHHFFNSWKNN